MFIRDSFNLSRSEVILRIESKLYFNPIAVAEGKAKYAIKNRAVELDKDAVLGATIEIRAGNDKQQLAPAIMPMAGVRTKALVFWVRAQIFPRLITCIALVTIKMAMIRAREKLYRDKVKSNEGGTSIERFGLKPKLVIMEERDIGYRRVEEKYADG